MGKFVCAVDVGTASARAAILDSAGGMCGRAEHAIALRRPDAFFAEHDSEDIWRAVCGAVREARRFAGVGPEDITGIAFDATCSLVLRGGDGAPLPLSSPGGGSWDTISWFDHRAHAEADECTATGDAALASVGGVMSPEMQIPKLMWLKRHHPDIWRRAGSIFDLADFLAWKASGSSDRSHCTLACKWTFQANGASGWRQDFFDAVGLPDLLTCGNLPGRSRPVGADLGPLREDAARALGLTPACRVAVGMIDAYAGALGVLGGFAATPGEFERRAALVAGTSSCVLLFSDKPRSFPGAWGPNRGVVFPGLWASEGGQSATGALLDHVIRWHGASGEPDMAAHSRIVRRVMELRAAEGPDWAARLHVLPDFHGNRSPFADPNALGVVSGLALDASFDGLCRLYWRTAVAIALGVRQILESIGEAGHEIDRLHLAGGHTRNPLLTELYADATGHVIVEPSDKDEAVLLGTAMAAATAAGHYPSLEAAAVAMHRDGRERAPDPATRDRYDRDYRIFQEMHGHRRAIDAIR